MSKLWIMRGDLEAPGWQALREDYQDEKVDIIHLDPKVWAVVDADQAPTGYEGLHAEAPQDGMYIDPNGTPLYLVAGRVVSSADEVVAALGGDAVAMKEKTGDATTALERLGRVF